MDKFAGLPCLRGTTGEAYLQGRGILQLPTESVRFCDRQIASGREYQPFTLLQQMTKALFATCIVRCWMVIARRM